ncbi:MAG: DUF5681 domain-containing protein [Chloroflexota bacterium]
MTKIITNAGQWKPGESGNPNGRKPKGRALTEMLRLKGDDVVFIGNEPVTAQEALAKAVWQFVTTGEVWLRGKKLEAQTIGEWASVVKWLYLHVEPASRREAEDEAEIIVRVTREDRMLSPDTPPIPQKFPIITNDEGHNADPLALCQE